MKSILLHEPRQRRSWLIFDVSQKMKAADVLPELLKACPTFEQDSGHLREESDGDVLYSALGDFARHLLTMKKDGRDDVLRSAAEFIERMHVEGDDYVMEAATIGVLESIQNVWGNSGEDPAVMRVFLLAQSKRWWDSLYRFWEGKIPYVGADIPKG